MPPAPKKKMRLKDKRNAWFDGTHYQKTQPFATFLTCRGKIVKKSLDILKKEIRSLIPTPSRSTALEIGPGLAPVISYFPFREAYYLEQSPAIARQLMKENLARKKKTKTTSHFIVGNIQKLPFSNSTQFDLVVMNEVLTHVPPGKRLRVLKKILTHTQHLLLVERPQPSYRKFLDSLYPEMRRSRTSAQLRGIYSAYTKFTPLLAMLRRNRWSVSIQRVVFGETYHILSAKRLK